MTVIRMHKGKDVEDSPILSLTATYLDPEVHLGPSAYRGEVLMGSEWTQMDWEDRLILLQDWIRDLERLYVIEREGSIG